MEIVARSKQSAEAALVVTRAAEAAAVARRQRDDSRHAELVIIAEIGRALETLGIRDAQADQDLTPVLESVGSEIGRLRSESDRIEEALAQVRSSQAASQVLDLERELVAADARLAATDAARSRIAGAQSEVREAEQAIQRLQGELVDEQLAALFPLLSEVYRRLCPHVDWPDIRYNLRGDIRRMLTLEVGSGLNPSFMFSSGQRRAAGLAFLLAIHMSRDWCKLETLVLDDPVQHVDDYRALHLSEVLGAVRLAGRQVVCTVEDGALAELLARRLRGTSMQPGRIVRLAYVAGQGCRVSETREIGPLSEAILVTAAAAG